MGAGSLLREARLASGVSQGALARRAGTSRPTLSAYEHGRKSPTLATTERLAREIGCRLALEPSIRFSELNVGRGRVCSVPDRLPRLSPRQAFALVQLPLHLHWSGQPRERNLSVRHDRARVYEEVLREGGPQDILRYVDGALLVDLWPEIVLPRALRAAWDDVIDAAVQP